MAAFGAGDAFMDDVRAAQTQIRSLLGADDDVSGSEWFDGGMSERTAASHFSQAARLSSGAGIIGRDVHATVGSRVVVVDPSLELVEPTGTIVEVRCDGGRVKVQHDSVDKAERYYSTGKDGHFQLGVLGSDDQRPRFSLPPPPSKVEARPEVSSALPAAAQRRPRYSEVRRSMCGPRRVGNSQTADSSRTADAGVDEPAALSRSHSVASVQTFQTAQTTAEAAQVAFDSSSRASSRPRYSELRKARASAVLAGQSAEAVDRMEASCASSMSNTVADISPRRRPTIGATADEAASGNHGLQAQARRRYSEQRRASRSPARPDVRQCGMDTEEGPAEGTTAGRSSCPPSNPAGPTAEEFSQLCRRLETLERDTASLASQLQSFREESLADMKGVRDQGRQQAEAYERHWRDETRRHLEACEEHLRQRFREENRQQLEATEHRIFKNVMQEFEGQLRGAVAKLCAPQSPQSQFEAEEPEQEYETPGPEETIRVEKKVFDISRAELADSELSLQTIGSIARRVSASLGGESRSAASSSTPQRDAAEKRALQQMHRLPSSRNDRSPRTEPSFEQLEQEMERLADMRRYASQVLGAKSQELTGSRVVPGSASQPFDAWQAAEESLSREIKEVPARRRTMPAAAPSPTFGRPETPGRTTSAERWKRRSSVQPEGAQAPACPWEEEQQLPASRVQWPADWQVDSQGRLIF